MATQQPPRPWFRLASMMRAAAPAPLPPPTRPPAPTTVLQPTPPLPPFRPPVGLPQPSTQPQETPRPPPPPPVASPLPPQATAPPSPIQLPARLPIASPPYASRSPVITSPAPRSPVGVPTPAAAPEQPSQAEPSKPESPIIATTPSDSTPRQVVSSSSLPPSPKTNAASAAPSPRLPTSPAPKTVLSSLAPQPRSPTPARIPSPQLTTVPAPPPPSPVKPIPSPNSIKQWDRKTPPYQSPILKPLSHPPSPLILPPPAQLKPDGSDYLDLEPIPAEAEQKTVLTQNIINDKPPKITTLNTSYKNGNSHGNKHGEEVKKDETSILLKKTTTNSSEEQFGMRIVTLAGENKGAVMELSSPSRKKATANNNGLKFHGSGRINDDQDGKNGFRKMQSQPPAPVDAFVNSNVQGVNNSILYNCAYSNRDPGVHLSVSRNGNAGRGAHHLLKDTTLHD